jgi:hypothetical protein
VGHWGRVTYSSSSTYLVTEGKNKDGTNQTSDFVNSSDEALIDTVVFRAREVVVEGCRGNDSRHHSLVVSEEEETSRGNGRDQESQSASIETSIEGLRRIGRVNGM